MFKITPSENTLPAHPYRFKKFIITLTHQKQKKAHLSKTESQNGRWTKEEHTRFIDAIIKYGNDWKKVQRHVATRTSTQARSHAQKFLMKLKRSEKIRSKKINLNLSWAKSISLIKSEFTTSELKDLLYSVSSSKKRKSSQSEKNEDICSTNEDEDLTLTSNDDVNMNGNWYNEENDNIDVNSIKRRKDSEYIKNFFDNFNTRKFSFEINVDAVYLNSCEKI